MQLNIPGEYESLLRSRAQAAGFDDRIDEYIIKLISRDTDSTVDGPPELDISNLSAESVAELIDEGYASGIAGEMDAAYFNHLRDDLLGQAPGGQAQN